MANRAVNAFDVPKRQWQRWTPVARVVFNATYQVLQSSWDLAAPESLRSVKPPDRRVFSWNAAWLAADEANLAMRAT